MHNLTSDEATIMDNIPVDNTLSQNYSYQYYPRPSDSNKGRASAHSHVCRITDRCNKIGRNYLDLQSLCYRNKVVLLSTQIMFGAGLLCSISGKWSAKSACNSEGRMIASARKETDSSHSIR